MSVNVFVCSQLFGLGPFSVCPMYSMSVYVFTVMCNSTQMRMCSGRVWHGLDMGMGTGTLLHWCALLIVPIGYT